MKSIRRPHFREILGLLAASATALQSGLGYGRQLYLACTQGTEGLSFLLFFSSFLGMALWATWAVTKPGGAEHIIAWPNAIGAGLAIAICVAILVLPNHVTPKKSANNRPTSQFASRETSKVPTNEEAYSRPLQGGLHESIHE